MSQSAGTSRPSRGVHASRVTVAANDSVAFDTGDLVRR